MDDKGIQLLKLARSALEEAVTGRRFERPQASWLEEPGATFVTLMNGEELRGCIGSIDAYRSLIDDLCDNAAAAAKRDHRFPSVRPDELVQIRVEVSLLSPLASIEFVDEEDVLSNVRPGVDGIVFECRGKRATFLPQVWDKLPNPREFFGHLKQKAGLDSSFWSDDIRLWRYDVTKWKEKSDG